MKPLRNRRWALGPALLIVPVWLITELGWAGEDPQPAASQPAASQPATQPAVKPGETTTKPGGRQGGRRATTAPVRPDLEVASRPSDQPSPPATKPARDRLAEFQRLRDQARRNLATQPDGSQLGDDDAAIQDLTATSQPTTAQTPEDRIKEARERAARERAERARKAREQLEERRRKARESAQQAAAQQQPSSDESDPDAAPGEEEGFQPDEEQPVEVIQPSDEAPPDDEAAGEEQPVEDLAGPGAVDDSAAAARKGRRTPKRPTQVTPRASRTQRPRGGQAQPDSEKHAAPETEVKPPLLPDDGRTEFMSFVDMPWEDVIKKYSELVGKPLASTEMSASVFGALTYKTDRRFTRAEIIDELNYLLAEQNWMIAETENYLYVVQLNELEKYLDPARFYNSLAEFHAAKLRDKEFASVVMQIPDQSAEAIRDILAPAMPEYAMPVVVGDTNALKIAGMAQDVRRFELLLAKVRTEEYDPRQTRFFEIKTNVTQIEEMVRDYFDLSTQTRRAVVSSRLVRGRPTPQVQPQTAEADKVVVIADERTKTLIVKATPSKLDEIEAFIKKIDEKPDIGEFDTHVIEVKNGDASEIANVLNKIFEQERGQTQRMPLRRPVVTRTTRMPTRTVQTGQAAPEDVILEDIYEQARKTIRIVADERTNSLIVYANPGGLKRVQDLLEVIDQPMPSNFRTFKLEHADAADTHGVVQQVAASLSGGLRSRTRSSNVVLDEGANALHVIAEREEMKRIETIIQQLDVPGQKDERRLVELVNVRPSEMKVVVDSLLGSDSRGVVARRPMRGAGGPTVSASAQSIALDSARLLIVICTDEEWQKVEETIRIWDDSAMSGEPVTRFFDIHNADVDGLANTLGQLYRRYSHPTLGTSQSVIEAQGGRIFAQAVQPAIDEIEALLPELDVAPQVDPITILPIENAAVTEILPHVQSMLSGADLGRGARRGRGGGAPGGPTVSAEPVTNALIIQADEETVLRIKEFVKDLDARVAAQQPERRFYTLRNAAPQEVAQAVAQIFDAAVSGGRGLRGSRGAVGSQIKTVVVGNQLVVDAPAIDQARIASFVAEMDEISDQGVTTVLVKMPGADVNSIAARLTRVFQDRVRTQNVVARFEPDVPTESILMTVSKDIKDDAETLLGEYRVASEQITNQIEFYQMKHGAAAEVARWLRDQLVTLMDKQFGRAASQQVQVTPDERTNRLIISAPQVAVAAAKTMLEQYDIPVPVQDEAPQTPLETGTLKLPGLDVANIAQQLDRLYRERPQRPDKLRYSFGADRLTEMLIYTVPKDSVTEVEELVAKFTAESNDLTPEQKFIAVTHADANYVAQQLQNILSNQIRNKRGADVWSRVSIAVDARTNRVVVNAPKFAIEMAEALIKELDQEPLLDSQLRTIALTNADAGEVLQTINQIFAEDIKNRTLRVTAEPLTNAIIVGGLKEKFEEIETWARDLDQQVGAETPYEALDLKYADINQVIQTINNLYGGGKRGRGAFGSQQVQVTPNGNTLVVKAPAKQMQAIKELVALLDTEAAVNDDIQVRMFDLKVLRAADIEQKVMFFLTGLNYKTRPGQLRPAAFAEPTTNTLVVLAPKDTMPFIEGLITQIEAREVPLSEPRVYDVVNVRADSIARSLEGLLRAKVAEKTGGGRGAPIQPTVVSEPTTNRLVIYAPGEYQDMAGELLKMLDKEATVGEITQIIQLENGDANELARTLSSMAQGRGGRAPADVTVVADAGSNSVILSGLPREVAKLEEHVRTLETGSTAIPELQIIQLRYANATDVEEALANIFPAGRNPADTVTVSTDDFYNRVMVTANKRKMRQVEAFIGQLDAAPEYAEGGSGLPGGKDLYFVEVNRGDPFDIAWEVSDFFPPADRGGPQIDSDFFGEYIRVICRPDELPKIEEMIRKFEARAKPEMVIKKIKPKGDMARYLEYLKLRNPDVLIDMPASPALPSIVEQLHPDDEDQPPASDTGAHRDAPPAAPAGARRGRRAADSPFVLAAMQTPAREENEQDAKPPADKSQAESRPAADQKPVGKSPLEKEEAQITVLPDGSVIMRGPKSAVDEIEDTFSLIEEDLEVGEVIRIFQFRHGDVNAASRVLQQMFNDPVQRLVRPQQPQQGQQQPNQRGGRGQQPGQEGEGKEQQQGGLMQQLQAVIGAQQGRGGDQGAAGGAGGGQRIRVATDASHNYIIVKCEESLLPEIKQLLRELDIPPAEVETRVFQLKILDAEETAQNLKSVLGIDKAARPGGLAQQAARGGANPQLLELLQQSAITLGGAEGGSAKIESVEIVANRITNSLLVSAPPEVTKLISELIEELEGLEGREVIVIRAYELQQAKVQDMLPLLTEIFAGAAGGGGRGPRGGGSPADLGPVTISGDPRNNTIIYSAQGKDVELVARQIEALDIEGALAEVETYVCKYGDATSIASTVSDLFITGAGGAGRRGQPVETASTQVRITAEPMTNTILVFGPPDERDRIFTRIIELDEESRRQVREIEVAHADPGRLAEQLTNLFGGVAVGGAPGGPGRRGGGAQAVSRTQGPLVIFGSKEARKLLLRAPDALFEQIKEVVTVLDQPNEGMKVRRYQLKYADAEVVVAAVKGAMFDFIQNSVTLGGAAGDLQVDAFTAVAEPRSNAILVLGSEQTFTFVETILTQLDVDTPEDQRKQFRIHVLRNADAATVADAINSVAAGAQLPGQAGQGGGRRGGPLAQLGQGITVGGEDTLDVRAVAEPATNAVMLYGKPEDLDVVEAMVMGQLENAVQRRLEKVAVSNVKPSQIVGLISPLISERSGAQSRVPPQITPNDNGAALLVFGTQTDIEHVRELTAQFDVAGLMDDDLKVIPVPFGQDTVALAGEVERVINDGERIIAEMRGTPPRMVTIGASGDQLLVYGDPALYAKVEAVVAAVTKGRGDVVTRVIELKNLASEDAMTLIGELQERRSSASRGTGTSRTTIRPSSGSRSGAIRRPSSSSGSSPSRPPSSSGGTRRPTTPRRQPGDNPPRPPGGAFLWQLEHGTGLPGCGTAPECGTGQWPVREPQPGYATGQWPVRGPMLNRPLAGSTPTRPAGPALGTPVSGAALVATTYLVPALLMAPGLDLADAQAQDAGAQPGQSTQPSSAEPPRPSPTDSAPAGDAAAEGPALGTITGTLQGDVLATPVDSRRIIIQGDERDVDFILRMLQLMEATTEEPVVEVFHLKFAKATALAPTLENTLSALIEASGGAGDRTNRFSIIAEARSNSLIITASESNLAWLAQIIERLDLDKDQAGLGTQFKTVKLQHIRAEEAVAVLTPVIDRMNTINEVPTESRASIEGIDRSNALFVVGLPDDVARIEEMIAGIDVELPAEDDFSTVRALFVQLTNAKAEDLGTVLTQMIEAEQRIGGAGATQGRQLIRRILMVTGDGRELPPLDLDKPVRILPEKGTNSLVIFSSPKNNESLQEIVKLFDTLPSGAEVDVKSITLHYGQAEQVATLLQQMFDEGKKALLRPSSSGAAGFSEGELPPIPPTPTGQGLPYNVFVSHDARSNSVVVVGRRDATLLAASLIAELDKPGRELAMQPHLIPLQNYDATRMQEKLTELLDKRAESLGGDGNAARDNAVVVPDDRSNTLMVLASQEMFELIEDMASQLDRASSYTIVDSQWRRLEFADAVKLASMLQMHFESKAQTSGEVTEGGQKNALNVLADSRSNSLLMTGTRDFLQEADGLIAKFDQAYEGTVEFKVRPILLNSAAQIAALLTDMIEKAKSTGQQAVESSPIHVAADAYSNNLLLAASHEDMLRLERWIDVLDRPAEPGRVTRIIPLLRGDAEQLAQRAQEIFRTETTGGVNDVTVTYEPGTNAVITIGPPRVVTDIEDLIKKLNEADVAGHDQVRLFKLAQADAETAGELLRNILEGRGGSVGTGAGGASGGTAEQALRKVITLHQQQHPETAGILRAFRDEIRVIDDLRTNSLVVTAPPESMPLIESLVVALDVPPDAAKIKVFPLRNSDAQTMVDMLNQLFESSSGQGQGQGQAGGTGAEQETLLTLEGAFAEGGRQRLTFTVDTRTNSVVAAGTPGYLDLVEQLILDLDSQPIPDRKTMVYAPRNNEALAIQSAISEFNDGEQALLNELGEEISTTQRQQRQILAIASEDTNRLILSYDPRRETDVLDLVSELDQPPAQVMIQVLIVEVTMGDALELGVEFAFQDLQFTKAGPDDTNTFDFVGGTDIGAAGAGLGGFTFTITGQDFNFLFRTLQNESRLNVLSRPQIVAMDNQEASIRIFQSVPFVSGSTVTQAGIVQTQVNREDIGIELTVTPHINPDGYVRLEIQQEVAELTDSTVDIGGGVAQPITLERVMNTVVTVRDNETVVLGGLIRSRESSSETKVPILGDVPVLGMLMSDRNKSTDRTELLIIMTPRVVRSVEDYRELSTHERDRLTVIPDEVLTSDLMEKLRVPPEELRPRDGGDMFGPFQLEPKPEESVPDPDVYGPVRPKSALPPPRTDSYDIPVSTGARASDATADGRRRQ